MKTLYRSKNAVDDGGPARRADHGGGPAILGIDHRQRAERDAKNTMPAVTTIGDIQHPHAQYRMAITEHIGTGNADDMAKILTNINDRKKHLETQFDTTHGKSLASDAKDNEPFATDKKLFAEYQEVAAKVVDLSTNFGRTKPTSSSRTRAQRSVIS